MTLSLKLLSLGAGVQSTVLALMACDGTLPGLDGAIFADTGWEPPAVYEQVDRLQAEFDRAGIPLYRVSQGNIRDDITDPESRFASVPWYILQPESKMVRDVLEQDDDGNPTEWGPERPATLREREGIGRRQCTSEYKLRPIGLKVRELLGAKAPDFRSVPRGNTAEQWIGFSTDEIHRVNDKQDNLYTTKRYPLLELDMSRKDCERWLKASGWGHTAKSACIGCPFHGNEQWRNLRDNHPDQWADAVAFDRQIRKGGARGEPLTGEAFLHRSRVPLDLAPINRVSQKEWGDRQMEIFDELAEYGDPDGCSPYGCRSGDPAIDDEVAA